MTATPSGWAEARFRDVLKPRYGKALPVGRRDRAARYPVVGSAGVMTATAEALVREPVVVIGRKGNVGEVRYLRDGCWPIDTTYYVIVPNHMDANYLTNYLRHLDLKRLDSSTATPSLRRQDLEAQVLRFPALAEQRRIVEILEEHLSHLDAAHSSLTLAHARQVAWMKSTLQELVWDESLPLTTVAEVLREPMRNGRSDRSSEEPSAVRTLTLTAVTQGDFSERNTKRTTTTRDVAAGLWLEPGDVFVQRSNTPELVGTSARYDGPREWAIFPDLLIRLRPDEGLMDSRFLVAALQSERAHRTMRARAKGLAGSMPKIDQQAVGDTVLPLPSMERQREIIGQLAKRRSESNRLKSSLDTATRRGQALRRAVLAAAFAGKLTGRRMDVEVIEELAQQ